MIAIVVFMVIMIGGLSYFTLPQSANARQKLRRLAVAAAKQRMETIISLGFTGVSTDSTEVDTSISLANSTGNRSTTITYVDDSGDGTGGSDADADTVDYKSITVSVTWNDGSNQSVSLATSLSAYGQ